jgi:hypothetical protein
MRRTLVILFAAFAAGIYSAPAQPSVRVEPLKAQGQRPLEQMTADAVVRDFLQSWQSLQSAFDQNRADLLDANFVGDALDKLSSAIQQQTSLGIRTQYHDLSHDLQIVFYSPEGLSVELTDDVEYEVQLFDHDEPKGTQHLHARYVAILTPSESSWRVRVLQADPQ